MCARPVPLAFLILCMSASAAEPGNEPTARMLANTCFPCHGPQGKGALAMPSLEGRSSEYIEQRLIEYRDDRLAGTVMNRIAKGFTAAEIARLSRLFPVE